MLSFRQRNYLSRCPLQRDRSIRFASCLMRGRESVTSKRIAYRVWVQRSKCVKLNFVDKPVCLSSAAWTVLGEQTKLAATRRSSMFKSGLIFVFGSVPFRCYTVFASFRSFVFVVCRCIFNVVVSVTAAVVVVPSFILSLA